MKNKTILKMVFFDSYDILKNISLNEIKFAVTKRFLNTSLFCWLIYDPVYATCYNAIFIKLIGNSLQTALNQALIYF